MHLKPFYLAPQILALWPWPLDPKVHRAYTWLIRKLHVKFHEDRCKGEAVMRLKPYSVILALWPWPLTYWPQVHRVHTQIMGRLHVTFHEDRCKGEAVMGQKPFSVILALWPWPLDPKFHRAHAWLMGRLHGKFHEDRCKGEAVMRLKPFYLTARLQTDRRTDRRTGWFQYTPPNFVAGGMKNLIDSQAPSIRQ